jgi:type VI secretion system protein ImpG
MESLLPYYERELTFLRRLSHDFAKRYPKVAGRLLLSGETCDDPHIERLIESFAFLAGRIHKKLDDDYPEFTDSLLQVVYPQYLRPFPSVSIAHFDGGGSTSHLSQVARIPRHTMLETRPVRGLSCRFRTAYDVDIWPVSVTRATYETALDTNGMRCNLLHRAASAIRLDLSVLSESLGFETLNISRLRFFLNGEPALVALIREALFSKPAGIWVTVAHSNVPIELPLNVICPVGFAENESLLDGDARSHQAHQLLLEYFVFPEKFNFFDLDLSLLKGKLPDHIRVIEIRIGLSSIADNHASGNLLERISKDNFILGCSPVVNLFRQKPEPIRVTGTMTNYPIIVDSRRPHSYEIYEIQRVFRVGKETEVDEISEFKPFYSIRHADSKRELARYWHASYVENDSQENYTMELSLVDSTMKPEDEAINTLSLDLICTNRDLPSQLPFGLPDGDLFIEGGSVAKMIRMLRKPTQSYRFPRGRGAQWRLISHLALNHLSLSGQGADAIREILGLYDIGRSSANSRQINGIVAIENRSTMARIAGNPFPVFVRGIEIRITVDESHYAGIGLFMFVQVLDHFFGLYVPANSFTQLVVVSKHSGQELIKCPPRNGTAVLA